MKIVDIRAYSGRSPYSHQPVVRILLDLEDLVDVPTCDIPGFNERLLQLLPGLQEHKCSVGTKGGFCQRLERGTYLAHVLEHTAIELQNRMGYALNFGKARYLEKETIYRIVYSYIDEVAGLEAGRLAFRILEAIIAGEPIDVEGELEQIKKKAQEHGVGPSTGAILEEAKKQNIPIIRIGENSLFQLGYGKYGRRIQAAMTDQTSCIAVDVASDKELCKEILKAQGIPVPPGRTVERLEEAYELAEALGYPVVIKPHNGNQGKGVSLNLRTPSEVERAFAIAKDFSHRVMVEKHIKGRNYRIAVVGDKVAAVAQRLAAHVVGTGKHTIAELIELENQNPLRGEGHEKPLTKIKIDPVMRLFLLKHNRSLQDIPPKGEVVFLRENDNLSTGGIGVDVTDEIHPENARLAVAAARAVGLDIAGIDMAVQDISLPLTETEGAIIEVNACPGIRMHHYPSKGTPRNVAGEIIKMMFPEGSQSRIPIISVTGTNGKTTTTRMLGKILKAHGLMVGMTTTGGVYVGDELVMKGDTTGPKSAKALLMDPRVEAAVLETARGGIVNKGLGYDWADVGIITNIGDDHLGIDGINTLEEMADVKSLVVEAVKDQGWAVLNAEDPLTPQIQQTVRCNLMLFSTRRDAPLMEQHLMAGGTGVYTFNDQIFIQVGEQVIPFLKINEIPATMGGLLKHNIENSLAAIAGAYGLGIPLETIGAAMTTFTTDLENNPGRFNLFTFNKFRVIVDYGHNIQGYGHVLESLKRMRTGRLVGIIGVPGDRTDISIIKIGELSGKYFDMVYIKEDLDLRGRIPGEVAHLLKKGCSLAGLPEDRVIFEPWEVRALELAMENALEGDLIVVFYEELEPLVQLLETYRGFEAQEAMKNPMAKVIGKG